MSRRVVVTGVGMVTPLGHDAEQTFAAMCSGASAVGVDSSLTTTNLAGRPAPQVRSARIGSDFPLEKYLLEKEARRMDPFIVYAIAAAKQAWAMAGLPDRLENTTGDRAGCVVGVGYAGVGHILESDDLLYEKGPRRLSPFFIPSVIANLAPGHIGMMLNLRGPNWTPASEGASGAHAIGEAFRHIADGRCDLMVAGGAETAICPLVVAGLHALKLLSVEDSNAAVHPLSDDAHGLVPGEGAGVVVLESLESATKRGAKILAEVVGYGCATETDVIQPEPTKKAFAKSMRLSLKEANLKPSDVGYVNAHASGSMNGDRAEFDAIDEVFTGSRVTVSSQKAQTGHMLGGAGGVDAIVGILGLSKKELPGTGGSKSTWSTGNVRALPSGRHALAFDAFMTNNYGLGGTHTSLVVRRFR